MRKLLELLIDLFIFMCTMIFVLRLKVLDFENGTAINGMVIAIFKGMYIWLIGCRIAPNIVKHILDTLIRWHHSTKAE